jgi:oxygen-dependent protoporphyrinogen oxidase
VLRAFLGGVRNAGLLSESDDALIELARRELFEILTISAVPVHADVQRWPRAMAQYAVGHGERMKHIGARVAELPGLHLAGNAYDGIGISDCVRLGRGASRAILEAHAADEPGQVDRRADGSSVPAVNGRSV